MGLWDRLDDCAAATVANVLKLNKSEFSPTPGKLWYCEWSSAFVAWPFVFCAVSACWIGSARSLALEWELWLEAGVCMVELSQLFPLALPDDSISLSFFWCKKKKQKFIKRFILKQNCAAHCCNPGQKNQNLDTNASNRAEKSPDYCQILK